MQLEEGAIGILIGLAVESIFERSIELMVKTADKVGGGTRYTWCMDDSSTLQTRKQVYS